MPEFNGGAEDSFRLEIHKRQVKYAILTQAEIPRSFFIKRAKNEILGTIGYYMPTGSRGGYHHVEKFCGRQIGYNMREIC